MSTLKLKLLVAFLSAVVIPLVVTNWLVMNETKNFEVDSFRQSFHSEMRQIENSVNIMFTLYQNHVNLLSKQPEFYNANNDITTYMSKSGSVELTPNLAFGPEADVYQLFTTIAAEFADLAYLYYGTEQGGYLQWPLGGLTDNYDPRPRPWYRAAVNANGETVRVPAYYWAADDSTVISTVKLLFDDANQPIGVIGMDLTLSKFTEILEKVDFGLDGSIIVIEDSGRILANTRNKDMVFTYASEVYESQFFPENAQPLPKKVVLDNEEYLVSSYYSPQLNWTFIGLVPQFAVNQQVKPLSIAISTVALIAVACFGIAALLLANFISRIVEMKHQQLLHAKSLAEQASIAKSQFLANMSHEIRTPLNGVLGMTQLLSMTDLNLNQKEKLKTIESSGKLLMEIINDILDFSKIEAQKLELHTVKTDLVELITNIALSHHANAVQKNLELVIDTSEILDLLVEVDDIRLSQVLGNLLSNSIKFTEKGHILLKCRSLIIDDPNHVLLEFQVSDTGIGMSKTQQEKIFAAFAQADNSTTRKYGGTGLGLALCQSIIELMGSQLRVFSKPEKGSVFKFRLKLPVYPSESNAEQLIDLSEQQIVILEPVNVNLKILSQFVKRCGANCKGFENSQDAKDYLRGKPDVDILFVSDELEGYSGISFYQYVTRYLPKNCYRFLLTNSEQYESCEQTLAKVSAVFVKPISEKRLNGFLTYHLRELSAPLTERTSLESSSESIEPPEPERSPDAQTTKKETLSNNNTPSKTTDILVVEDNLINFKVVEKFLHSLGFNAHRADCGESGVEMFKTGSFPLVLMDCMLPGIDGYTATAQIRQYEQDKNLPPSHIIALTADVTHENRSRCLDSGMNNYVGKPFDFDVLKQSILDGIR